MPTRYRDLESVSLIDVGARSTSTQGANASSQLADVFASFSRAGSDVGAQLSSELGARRGAEAGATGAPKMRSTLTAYGKAYNDSATRSYAIRAENDANETAARLEVEAGTDVEKFRKSMEEVRRATVGEAPAEARAIVDEIYARRSGQGLARIQGALATELRDEGRELISEDIAQRVERISVLRSNDDAESIAEATEEQLKLQLMIDGAVNTGDMSPTEGEAIRRTANRDIIFNTVKQRFQNELEDPAGDPIGMIEDVKEIIQQDQSLTPEEEAKLESALMASLSDHNQLRNARRLQADAQQETLYGAGDKYATELLLSGELTHSKLLQMVELDQLKPATARTLQNELDAPTRTAKSDPKELFTVETNLLRLTEEDIVGNRGLVWADRSRLIQKRREELASWKGTQVAREAFDRIDRALGIVPGVDPRMLSEEELEMRDSALTELYNVIDALPPEEQQAALLPRAQEVIQSRIRTTSLNEADRLRGILQRYRDSVGDPAELDGTQRKDYDEAVALYERMITEAMARAQQ